MKFSVKNTQSFLLFGSSLLAIGFFLGLFFGGRLGEERSRLATLRLNGYKFISPLLVCDTDSEKQAPELEALERKLKALVEKKKTEKDVVAASVYFRDFKTGNQLNIGGEETYYPASLNKISVMIAYFKLAEADPALLEKKLTVNLPDDLNATQEIKPAKAATNGNAYTVMELIEMAIKYSDNMASTTLVNNIDRPLLEQTFKDLNIPVPQDDVVDYMKANDFSYFLRVLYNATYLKKDYSEKALHILSEVDFKEGLMAGMGSGVVASHKFGLKTYLSNDGVPVGRELHDCGIVYNSDRPYLLCVMTKSTSSLEKAKGTVKEISSLVFGEAKDGFR